MAKAIQTWDNVIDYIKLNLGADVQKLEFNDDRLIEIIKEQSLAEYSAYESYTTYYTLTTLHLISESPFLIYEIGDDFPYRILELKRRIDQTFDYGDMLTVPSAANIVDNLIRANYLDMSRITRAEHSMRFDPPNRIMVIEPSINYEYQRDFILELGVVHESPLTIHPGTYDLFKNLALGDIMIFLAKIRNKFNNFGSPFGQINLDADQLLQEGKEIKGLAIQELKRNPPDQYIWNL